MPSGLIPFFPPSLLFSPSLALSEPLTYRPAWRSEGDHAVCTSTDVRGLLGIGKYISSILLFIILKHRSKQTNFEANQKSHKCLYSKTEYCTLRRTCRVCTFAYLFKTVQVWETRQIRKNWSHSQNREMLSFIFTAL